MRPITYYQIMRNSKDKKINRYQIVRYAEKHGNKPAARTFNTTVKTVRKWRKRFEDKGYNGLEDLSRRPHHSPNKTPKKIEDKVVKLKKKYKRIGAEQIKILEDVPVSPKTMRKIWKERKVPSRKRRKKHVTKNNLRAIKKQFPLFKQVCEDTKELMDIPEYWKQVYYNPRLPKKQYTFREVSCGIQFLGFADEISITYSTLFAEYINYHLLRLNIDLSNTIRQTDNGVEYVGSWLAIEPSAYTLAIESVPGQRHSTIPAGAHRMQADVETVHDIIEREFYEIETFDSYDDFMNKIYTYQLFFNLERPNTYKENKTPWQLAQEKIPDIAKDVFMIPPIDLRILLKKKIDLFQKGGYDVSSGPYFDWFLNTLTFFEEFF